MTDAVGSSPVHLPEFWGVPGRAGRAERPLCGGHDHAHLRQPDAAIADAGPTRRGRVVGEVQF